MRRIRLTVLTVPLALVLAMGWSSAAEEPRLYDRIYLLASDEGFQYWGVDPNDPELAVAKVTANCPGSVPFQGNGATCFASNGGGTPAQQNLDVRFSAGSLPREAITWNAANPLRYHLEMKVSTTFTPTVGIATERGGAPTESAAAMQVAPNVWEGKLTSGGPLLAGDKIRVRVRVPYQYHLNRTSIEIATGGASWIQLPRPFAVSSVPDLLGQSAGVTSPQRFDTPSRHFTFNDSNYTVGGPFTGDLSQPTRFDLPIPSDAAIVYAWVEAYENPFIHEVLTNRSVDARRVNDAPMLTLFHDDDRVTGSTPEANQQQGRGTNALAATSLPAGMLSLEVKARPRFTSDLSALEAVAPPDHPYQAYVLAVHGRRTLQSMRWRFEPAISEPFIPATGTGANTCINPSEPVPTTGEVSTFTVDLRWDTPSLNTAKYTLTWNAGGQEFNFCGQLGGGSRVRLVNPAERLWQFAPTPAKDTVMAGYRDTIFEMAVRFAYTPVPAA